MKQKDFAYPVYLVGNMTIAQVSSAAELNHYEAWILLDETRADDEPGWKLRPFDANFVLLSLHDLGFGHSEAIELFTDPTLDHSADPLLMRLLLISLLGVRQPDGLPEGYREFSFDSLLALALRLCPE